MANKKITKKLGKLMVLYPRELQHQRCKNYNETNSIARF
jgi:hypothetical protein